MPRWGRMRVRIRRRSRSTELWQVKRPDGASLRIRKLISDLHCRRPFAACGCNIRLSPLRPRAQEVITASDVFSGKSAGPGDAEVLRRLGDCTPERKWLAASLAKTLRLQLHL